MIHMREQIDKSLSLIVKPQCIMYWTSPDVLMISSHLHHGNPLVFWTNPNVLMVSLPPVYRTHIIYYGSTAPRVTCRSSKKEEGHPGKHYASPDWIRLIVVYLKISLPCNTMFLIRLSTNNLHFFQANCALQHSQGKCLLLDAYHLIFHSIVSAFVCTLLVWKSPPRSQAFSRKHLLSKLLGCKVHL